MATLKANYAPSMQVASFRHLQEQGYITDLTIKKSFRGNYRWEFTLSQITFRYQKKHVTKDFSNYRCQMIYKRDAPPKIFIIDPVLPKSTKHLYKNGSLCLYKPSLWKWQNQMKFHEELFPTLCTWLYHYEIWRQTGNWYGPEAPH